jgi:hypothetical protein
MAATTIRRRMTAIGSLLRPRSDGKVLIRSLGRLAAGNRVASRAVAASSSIPAGAWRARRRIGALVSMGAIAAED